MGFNSGFKGLNISFHISYQLKLLFNTYIFTVPKTRTELFSNSGCYITTWIRNWCPTYNPHFGTNSNINITPSYTHTYFSFALHWLLQSPIEQVVKNQSKRKQKVLIRYIYLHVLCLHYVFKEICQPDNDIFCSETYI